VKFYLIVLCGKKIFKNMLNNENYFRKLSKQANVKIETMQEAMITDKPDDKNSNSNG
jgi:LPS O-antigen subunit length determinant protein (WzzB/FepE family)